MGIKDVILYDSLTITPDNCVIIEDREGLSDSEENEELIVKVDATHVGYVNRNFYNYNAASVKKAAPSWITPHQLSVLPISSAHLPNRGEPVGKVIDVSYKAIRNAAKDSPKGKLVLTLKILDHDTIRKIKNGLYETVSVGSKAKSVKCSICGDEVSWDHEHQLGKEYDGKLCYWDIEVDYYREVSFANLPADISSTHVAGVTKILTPEEAAELNKDTEEDIETFYWDNYEGVMTEYKAQGLIEDKTLTKKERDALPASAFCGPKRSFLNISKGHIKSGLGMLALYKGPGDKDKIRACLIRHGKKYGMTFKKDKKKKDNDNTIGVSDMENAKDVNFEKIQKELADSIKEVGTLKDTIKAKEDEIKSLSDKLKVFEDLEKSRKIAQIIDLKVKLSSKDVIDYIEETDDKEKEKLYKKLEDSFSEKSSEELEFVIDSLSNIEIPVEDNNDTVSDLDTAAEQEEGNVKADEENSKEDEDEPNELDKKFIK